MNSHSFTFRGWNELIAPLPGAHVLQSREWAEVKSHFGWLPLPYFWKDDREKPRAAAMVLLRQIPIRGLAARLSVMYVPKGPLLDWGDRDLRGRVLDELADLARRKRAIFIKIDPDVRVGIGIPGQPEASEQPIGQAVTADLLTRGWRFSEEQVQFRNTVMLDLTAQLDDLLMNMKQKTRYNIRLAERKGVCVRTASEADFGLLYQIYAETSLRDGFVIREEAYYRTLWSTFLRAGMLLPLIAEVEGEIVAGAMVFTFARKAWFINGMSRLAQREKMPNYLLQWEAIQRLKALGCQTYDLWGAPDVFQESDPLWGVFRFKQGWGGEVVRHIGAWDLPLHPFWYRLYTHTLPRLLDLMRRRGKARVRKLVP